MENIQLLDLISLGLIAFLGLKGFFRGFVKETFGLIGIIGGIYFASRFAGKFGDYINQNIYQVQNPQSLKLIGFIGALLAFWLAAVAIGAMLGKLVNSSGLGIVDKILGFGVGGAKVFLIFSVIIYVLTSIPIFRSTIESAFSGSMMYPYFKEWGSKIVKLSPEEISNQNAQTQKPIMDDEE
jgi:membrane protein required for colicin V production